MLLSDSGPDGRCRFRFASCHPVIADELVRRGVMRSGLIWHFSRPPVVDLEYEMDCRTVLREIVI